MFPRHLQPELMDDPALPPDEHHAALNALARINTLSSVKPQLWRTIAAHLGAPRPSSITLADIATGSGDVAVGVAQCATRAGVRVDLRLCDISDVALAAAAQRASGAGISATPIRADVVRDGLPLADASVDIAMSSLFLHHLEDDAVVRVLAEMRRVARRGVVISDLRRCRRGEAAAYVVSRVITRSRIVHVDAVRSVQGAFTVEELSALATRAGFAYANIRSAWPFRMLLTCKTG